MCFALIVLCLNELFVPLSCFVLSWVGLKSMIMTFPSHAY